MSDDLDLDGNESEGIKSLRKQHKELTAKLAERDELLNKFLAKERTNTVAEVLAARGVNPKAASFYTAEDASEDAVGKWLEENAEVFGIKQTAPPVNDPNADAARRVANASFGASDPTNGWTLNNGVPTGDPEVLANLMKTQPISWLVANKFLPAEGDRGHRWHGADK